MAAKPTVKLHLVAIRILFDWLVVVQAFAVNPAHAVRGPKHVVRRGKPPVLIEKQARLFESIGTSAVVGLRDRALIGVMTYAFCADRRGRRDCAASGQRLPAGGKGLTASHPPQPAPPRDQWIAVVQLNPRTLSAPLVTFLSVRNRACFSPIG